MISFSSGSSAPAAVLRVVRCLPSTVPGKNISRRLLWSLLDKLLVDSNVWTCSNLCRHPYSRRMAQLEDRRRQVAGNRRMFFQCSERPTRGITRRRTYGRLRHCKAVRTSESTQARTIAWSPFSAGSNMRLHCPPNGLSQRGHCRAGRPCLTWRRLRQRITRHARS